MSSRLLSSNVKKLAKMRLQFNSIEPINEETNRDQSPMTKYQEYLLFKGAGKSTGKLEKNFHILGAKAAEG